MSITSVNSISKGAIIVGNGQSLLYVHDLIKTPDGDKDASVHSLVVFPVLPADISLGDTATIEIEKAQLTNKDPGATFPANAVIHIGDNSTSRFNIDQEQYVVNLLGNSPQEIIDRADTLFGNSMQAFGRYSTLGDTDEVAIPTQSRRFEEITGDIVGESQLDKTADKKRRKKYKSKAKTFVDVPDMYLEDAYAEKFISSEVYTLLTQGRAKEEIPTLIEALALTQSDNKEPLLKYIKGQSFNEVFETGKSHDEVDVLENPIVKSVAEMTLMEAFETGLLKNAFTTDAMLDQFIPDDWDPDTDDIDDLDPRITLSLDAAIAKVVLDEALQNYPRPNNQDLSLTKSQAEKIANDIKSAFETASKLPSLNNLTQNLLEAKKSLYNNRKDLNDRGKIFVRHDPTIPVAKSIADNLDAQKARIQAGKPARLQM
jgi:hypothetical protein